MKKILLSNKIFRIIKTKSINITNHLTFYFLYIIFIYRECIHFFKKVFTHTIIIFTIPTVLATISLSFYWDDYYNLKELWINLCAGFITLAFTSVIFDVILKAHKENKWESSRKIAKTNLVDTISTISQSLEMIFPMMVVRRVLPLINYDAPSIKKFNNNELSLVQSKEALQKVLDYYDINQILLNASQDKWGHYLKLFLNIRDSLDDLLIFKPPQVSLPTYNQMTIVRTKFKSFFNLYEYICHIYLFADHKNSNPEEYKKNSITNAFFDDTFKSFLKETIELVDLTDVMRLHIKFADKHPQVGPTLSHK